MNRRCGTSSTNERVMRRIRRSGAARLIACCGIIQRCGWQRDKTCGMAATSISQRVGGTAMKLPLTGGCLCQSIRYEITRPPILVYTCHCTDCQHITGSAFAIGVIVLDEAVRLSGKTPRVIESIADSGRVKGRCVCPDCATSVCGQPRPGTLVQGMVRSVLGGTLDDTS